MKVTVGAIRQIVREEAERLEEATPKVAGNQAIKELFGPSSWATKTLSSVPTGPLRNALVAALKGLIENLAGDSSINLDTLRRKFSQLGVEVGEIDIDPDTAAPPPAAESYDRDKLRNLIMAEASQLVQD
jgi:hypothetical protein